MGGRQAGFLQATDARALAGVFAALLDFRVWDLYQMDRPLGDVKGL